MDERARLLAAIADDPDAIDNWIVYADWLIERDDPRGELITLELAIEAKVANDEAVARHRALLRDEAALLSPRLEDQAHHLELDFWRGFIRGADVFGPRDDPPTREVLEALFADPHACLLRALELGEHIDLCEALSSPSVRELAFRFVSQCDLALDEWFPRLERLELRCRAGIDDADDDFLEREAGFGPEHLAHERLQSLETSECPALTTGNFDLPNLTSLTIAGDPFALFGPAAILTEPPPCLANLNCELSPRFVRALRTTRLCTQLRMLKCSIDLANIDELRADPTPDLRAELTVYCYEMAPEPDLLSNYMLQAFPNARIVPARDLPYQEPPKPLADYPAMGQKLDDTFKRIADRLRNRK